MSKPDSIVYRLGKDDFESVKSGLKTFIWTKADAGYKIGTRLCLIHGTEAVDDFMGESVAVVVTYIMKGPRLGIPDGYLAMSFRPASVTQS